MKKNQDMSELSPCDRMTLIQSNYNFICGIQARNDDTKMTAANFYFMPIHDFSDCRLPIGKIHVAHRRKGDCSMQKNMNKYSKIFKNFCR